MIIVIRKRVILYSLIVLVSFFIIVKINIASMQTIFKSATPAHGTIVVDAGHGGRDPGTISKNGTLEKDINLKIAKKIKALLQNSGYNVVMTREKDISLHDEGVKKRHASDIRNRIKTVDSTNPELFISIHLNSYSNSKYSGAQVFYHASSEKSREIAETIQKNIKEMVDKNNNRKAKGITNILLLRKTKVSGVIIECGFLSNTRDESLLKTEEYQQKMAEAIVSGVKEYLSMEKSNEKSQNDEVEENNTTN